MTDDTKTGLFKMFKRLVTRRVNNWQADYGVGDSDPAPIHDADVVTSLIGHTAPITGNGQNRHMVVLDIDHPAWLVKSTTPGHFHLYIDVPGGIDWVKYGTMLMSMEAAGVLESGFVRASLTRGYSSARLPWKKKPPPQPQQMPPVTLHTATPNPLPPQTGGGAFMMANTTDGKTEVQRLDQYGVPIGSPVLVNTSAMTLTGRMIPSWTNGETEPKMLTAEGNDTSTLAGALADATPSFRKPRPTPEQSAEMWDDDLLEDL